MSQMLDRTFYRSPAEAIAPPERLAYVAAFDPAGKVKDAITVIDCDPVVAWLRQGGRLERTAHRRQ
jgi:selenium-binding protein 1